MIPAVYSLRNQTMRAREKEEEHAALVKYIAYTQKYVDRVCSQHQPVRNMSELATWTLRRPFMSMPESKRAYARLCVDAAKQFKRDVIDRTFLRSMGPGWESGDAWLPLVYDLSCAKEQAALRATAKHVDRVAMRGRAQEIYRMLLVVRPVPRRLAIWRGMIPHMCGIACITPIGTSGNYTSTPDRQQCKK